MPSRDRIIPLSTNKSPSAEDVNVIYHILNGSYSNTRGAVTETTSRGLGMSVQLTGFDGQMSSGIIDVARYALEVRNRESTVQKTFAARRADNKIVFSVEGGLAYAVKDTNIATTPTQVIVHGTPAGGVLSGTYPNPSFPYSDEYARVYPTMIVAWYGAFSKTTRSGNPEVTDAPGWVFCDAATAAATVTLRDGTTGFVVPNMNDRIPIGASTVTYKATAGVASWSSLASVSIAHGHTINGHTHTITHAHDLNNHVHSLNSHVHGLNNHVHGMSGHTHDLTNSHTHNVGGHQHDLATGVNSSTGSALTNGLLTGGPSGTSTRADGGNAVASSTHNHLVVGNANLSGLTGLATTTVSTLNPSSGATSSPSSPNTGTPSPTSSEASVGNTGTSSGNTGGTDTANTGDSGTLSTASQTTLSAVNVQPPVLGWYWIMKL